MLLVTTVIGINNTMAVKIKSFFMLVFFKFWSKVIKNN